MAARSPSSVWVGGIRMSTTVTSGRCSITAARSALCVPRPPPRPRGRGQPGSRPGPPGPPPSPRRSRTARRPRSVTIVAQACDGSSTVTMVGPPAGLLTSIRPSTVRIRSSGPAKPCPRLLPGRRSPSSPTRSRSRPGTCTASSVACRARLCLATLPAVRPREVGDGLDRRRRALGQVHHELDGDLAACGQRGQRGAEAMVEHRRVDAAGQVAQLHDRFLGAAVRGVDQLQGPLQVGLGSRRLAPAAAPAGPPSFSRASPSFMATATICA